MSDPTETPRRERIAEIAAEACTHESDPADMDYCLKCGKEILDLSPRKALEARYGKVYDTAEATAEFEFIGFMAPYVVVTRKSDGVKGSLEFSGRPRFYFNFEPHNK